MIKALLFDFDGVLTTDKTGSLTTTRYLSRATGIDLARIQSVFREFNRALTLGQRTHADIWDDICRELGQPLSITLLDEAFDSTPMNTRMLSLAAELRTTYAVGIVTDNKKDRIDYLKRRHGLSALFDPIVVSAEMRIDKESPDIFREALRQLNADPHDCVFIDNNHENLVAPRSLGMKTVYFDDEQQDIDALRSVLRTLSVLVAIPNPPTEPASDAP